MYGSADQNMVTYTGYNLCRRSYKINKGISFDGAYN